MLIYLFITKHGNVICAKKSFVGKKTIKNSYLEQLKINKLNSFSNLKIFSVYLVKVLNIVSSNQNKNKNVLYQKNSKV